MKQYGGAASIDCPYAGGLQQWIVYDPELIKGDQSLHFALAHELAHHLHNDLMSGEPRSRKQELDADRYAAEYLASPPLAWPKEKLLDALTALKLPVEAQGTHPSLADRRQQVIAGYDDTHAAVNPPPASMAQSKAALSKTLQAAGLAQWNIRVNPTTVRYFDRQPLSTDLRDDCTLRLYASVHILMESTSSQESDLTQSVAIPMAEVSLEVSPQTPTHMLGLGPSGARAIHITSRSGERIIATTDSRPGMDGYERAIDIFLPVKSDLDLVFTKMKEIAGACSAQRKQ